MGAYGCPINRDAIVRIEGVYREFANHKRRVTVDELVAFAKVFGVEPASMLTAPECDTCNGAPPVGFTCQTCGRGAQ